MKGHSGNRKKTGEKVVRVEPESREPRTLYVGETDEGALHVGRDLKKGVSDEARKKQALKNLEQVLKEARVFWDIPRLPLKDKKEHTYEIL